MEKLKNNDTYYTAEMNRILKKNLISALKILLCAVFLQTIFFGAKITDAADQYCDINVISNTTVECFNSQEACDTKLNTYILTRNSHICKTVAQETTNQTTNQQTGTKGYALLAPIPTIDPNLGTPSLPDYLKGLVKLFTGLAIVLAVFVTVYGGVKQTFAVTPSSKNEGKKWLTGAVLGLIIVLFSYILLQTLNPALLNVGLNLEDVQFDPTATFFSNDSSPKSENVLCVIAKGCSVSCENKADATQCKAQEDSYRASGYTDCSSGSDKTPCIAHTCTSTGVNQMPKACLGGTGNGKCQPVKYGPCTVENLTKYFGGNAQTASIICGAESGGNVVSENKYYHCRSGESIMIGLFQVNITVHNIGGLTCAHNLAGSPFTGPDNTCSVIQSKYQTYQSCVSAAKNPDTNIKFAADLFAKKGKWWPTWEAARKCGIR